MKKKKKKKIEGLLDTDLDAASSRVADRLSGLGVGHSIRRLELTTSS